MMIVVTSVTPTAIMTDVMMHAAMMPMETAGFVAVAVATITIMVGILVVINAHNAICIVRNRETTIVVRMDELPYVKVSMTWS